MVLTLINETRLGSVFFKLPIKTCRKYLTCYECCEQNKLEILKNLKKLRWKIC